MAALPSAEERLCVLLSYHRLEPAERAQAQALAGTVEHWEDLWALADANGAAPLVYRNLRAVGLVAALPARVGPRFTQRAAEVRAENGARLRRARPVLAACVARGVRVVVLKGASLAVTVYGDPHYKRMSDVDVLVMRGDLVAVARIYREHGLAPLGGGGAHTGARARLTHHVPPHVSDDLCCMIDTQWALVTPLRGYRLDYDAMWARTEQLDFQGVALEALSPEDNLHHLCLHLGRYKIALGDLADIYNLLRHARARFRWERFCDDVARAGTAGAVHRALALAGRLCPMLEIDECVRALAPRVSCGARRCTERRTARLQTLLRIGTDHLEVVQRDFTVLGASTTLRARRAAFARLWRDVLRPPAAVALRMAGRTRAGALGRLRARLVAPLRILAAFAAEVGLGWVLRLAARSAGDLVCGGATDRAARRRRRDGDGTPPRVHAAACALLLGLLLLSGCGRARLYHRFFLTRCPADGPVAETELAMHLEPVPLDGYYADLLASAHALAVREVARVGDGGAVGRWPIYHIGPAGTAGGRRLLVVAGVHGNEIAGVLAAPRILHDLRTRPADYAGVELHLVAPANPVGLYHLSRYDAAGCDVNRDFGRFRTPEATAIRDVLASVAPELVVALHEGPQPGFHAVASRRVPPALTRRIAAEVAAAGIPLATRSFFGSALRTPGVGQEGRLMTGCKALLGLDTLGLHGERHGVGVVTAESPYGSTDLPRRIEAQLITVRAVARALGEDIAPAAAGWRDGR